MSALQLLYSASLGETDSDQNLPPPSDHHTGTSTDETGRPVRDGSAAQVRAMIATTPRAWPITAPVPDDLRGVWVRTLLQTDTLAEHAGAPPSDTTSWVRWLQTSRWHVDLRVPERALQARHVAPLAQQTPAQLALLAEQQGFTGVTTVETHPTGEVCTWLRHTDFQPPSLHPDAGWLLFERPDRLVEVGIHADYNEVWERLPGSSGCFVALGGLDIDGRDDGRRLLLAGHYLARVRPRQRGWPRGMPPGLSLTEALLTQPERAHDWLDCEISFGALHEGVWQVERSTLPELDGQALPCQLHRLDARMAGVTLPVRPGAPTEPEAWQILEWDDPEATLG